MQSPKPGIVLALAVIIVVATSAGLVATYKRFHVEEGNRRVEIALEWQEISLLSQSSGRRIVDVLKVFKQQHVSTLVVAEDTITSLEQSGAVRPSRVILPTGQSVTIAAIDTRANLDRVVAALELRGLPATVVSDRPRDDARTLFQWTESAGPASQPDAIVKAPVHILIATSADYANLRTMGVGLPPEALDAARGAGMEIAGRIGNFPGVNEASARKALEYLRDQGVSTVIFNGEEILGYRDRELEKSVASMLAATTDDNAAGTEPSAKAKDAHGRFPVYGAVEFGKQKGDEKLSIQLHGDYVRVHSIQTAEMGQMEEDEAVDRFVRAAKERNIRFCYVRLLTYAGQDPVAENTKFLNKIAAGMAHGSVATGGDMGFGPARRYPDTGVSRILFGIIALGAAAGTVWMLRALAPFPSRLQLVVLLALSVACVLAATLLDETGRKFVAFLAGIVYPTIACLVTFPSRWIGAKSPFEREGPQPCSPRDSLLRALRSLFIASLITAVGIVQVVGLLATRPFMMRANQFLGIKAQHAVPLLIVALVAVAGGVAGGESWEQFRTRALRQLREGMAEPARFGTLILGLVALVALVLVVARTGNDAGVGVSGTEMKLRALLDRVLPVRPRTKEFLVGHPAFVLALAWWWRGRRRLAVPAFVVGSLGQVSLLNTFCHIHTPLIISLWRDSLGLLFGVLLGASIFLVLEILFDRSVRKSGKPSYAVAKEAKAARAKK